MGKEKLSYVHRGGDPPLLGFTSEGLFKETVDSFPDHEALVSIPQRVRLSYAAFHHEIRCLAKALMALGISRGKRVGIWSTNNLEWVLLQMATAHVGAILVNINPAYRPRDLKHALERARVQALFLIPSFRTSNYVDMVNEQRPGRSFSQPASLMLDPRTGGIDLSRPLRYMSHYKKIPFNLPIPLCTVWDN